MKAEHKSKMIFSHRKWRGNSKLWQYSSFSWSSDCRSGISFLNSTSSSFLSLWADLLLSQQPTFSLANLSYFLFFPFKDSRKVKFLRSPLICCCRDWLHDQPAQLHHRLQEEERGRVGGGGGGANGNRSIVIKFERIRRCWPSMSFSNWLCQSATFSASSLPSMDTIPIS